MSTKSNSPHPYLLLLIALLSLPFVVWSHPVTPWQHSIVRIEVRKPKSLASCINGYRADQDAQLNDFWQKLPEDMGISKYGTGTLLRYQDKLLIATNFHVIQLADLKQTGAIIGITERNDTLVLKWLDGDPYYDLAFLEPVDSQYPNYLKPFEWAQEPAQTGLGVQAVGNSANASFLLSATGVISIPQVYHPNNGQTGYMAHNIALEPGYSGGPLLRTSDGALLGINARRNVSLSGASEKVGLAVPRRLIYRLLEHHFTQGMAAKRAFFGLEFRENSQQNVILADTDRNWSPGNQCIPYLKSRLIGLNDYPVKNLAGLYELLESVSPGATVKMTWVSDGSDTPLYMNFTTVPLDSVHLAQQGSRMLYQMGLIIAKNASWLTAFTPSTNRAPGGLWTSTLSNQIESTLLGHIKSEGDDSQEGAWPTSNLAALNIALRLTSFSGHVCLILSKNLNSRTNTPEYLSPEEACFSFTDENGIPQKVLFY